MKHFLACGWAMVFLVAGAAEAPPHIVVIMTDDMGWRDLGCQGNERIQTPRLDAFAEEGVRFTDAYAAAPVCSPTRAALITGLAPARLHITQHGKDGPQFIPKNAPVKPAAARHVLPLATLTLAERLKGGGYATGFFGKWHLSGDQWRSERDPGGPDYWPDRQGFDVNLGGCGLGGPPTYFDPYRIPALPSRKEGEYLTDRLADEAITFLRANRSKPMFVCLWTYNPHYPFEAPERLVAKYRSQVGPGLKEPRYAGQIEATDTAVGRVLDEIDQLGIKDHTLVIFTSDNGGWEGATDNRPLRSGKGTLYEGGIRVPLLIRWPGVTSAGTTNNTPVITMDLAATILDAAGSTRGETESLDGESLRGLLSGAETLQREAIFFHYPHYAWHKSNRPGAAIRSGPFKLIKRFDDGSVELYDLENDISEAHNLRADKPNVAEALSDQLDTWLQTTGANLPAPTSLPSR